MSDRSTAEIARALDLLKASSYDEEAWRTLYRELWPYVVGVVARALGTYDDTVQDVAQDTFLRLLRAGPATDFNSPEALRAYLRMAAVNTARSFQRSQRHERHFVRESSASSDIESGRSMEADNSLWESESLRDVLNSLGEAERQLVTLLVEGLTLREISSKLSISYSAAGVRLHRLRRKLSKLLGDNDLRRASG